ncbi:MAG: DUF3096 domain-containing protein [Thermoplasmata archaeon]
MASDLIPNELRAFFQRRGISLQVVAVLMIVFGLLIIVLPDLVGILVGLYLVVAGAVTLLGYIRKPPIAPQPEGG